MPKNIKVYESIVIDSDSPLTLEQLGNALHAQHDFIYQLIEYEHISPVGKGPDDWGFDSTCLSRAKRAHSFYYELEINMPGVALALDLLDQIEVLKKQIE